MSKNETLKKGFKDNLYGIPLDNILTTEELSDLEKERTKAVLERKRRREKPKKTFYKPDKKMSTALGIVLAGVFLLMLIKEPLIVRTAPRIYVTEALKDTVEKAGKDASKTAKLLFGFDAFNIKNANISFSADFSEDSVNKLDDVSCDVSADISFKNKEAMGLWNLRKDGENILNLSGYLTESQAGVNLGNFFSEYWTFPTVGFGKKWNKSGIKSVLYATQLHDECDISFSNVFSPDFVGEGNSREIGKLADSLFVSAKAKYVGKSEIFADDKSIKAREISFIFSPDHLQPVLVSVAERVSSDNKFLSVMDLPVKGELSKRAELLCAKLKNNIVFDRDINVSFFEYKGRIARIRAEGTYTENMHNTTFVFDLNLPNARDILNNVSLSLYVDGGTEVYSCNFIAGVNRSSRGKILASAVEFEEKTSNYSRKTTSNLMVNHKEKTVSGDISEKEGDFSRLIAYSGDIDKKRGVDISLHDLSVNSVDKGVGRSVKATADISILPKTINKISVGSKKEILELDKQDAEAYVKKIIETENFKKVDDCLKEIFEN